MKTFKLKNVSIAACNQNFTTIANLWLVNTCNKTITKFSFRDILGEKQNIFQGMITWTNFNLRPSFYVIYELSGVHLAYLKKIMSAMHLRKKKHI